MTEVVGVMSTNIGTGRYEVCALITAISALCVVPVPAM